MCIFYVERQTSIKPVNIKKLNIVILSCTSIVSCILRIVQSHVSLFDIKDYMVDRTSSKLFRTLAITHE